MEKSKVMTFTSADIKDLVKKNLETGEELKEILNVKHEDLGLDNFALKVEYSVKKKKK